MKATAASYVSMPLCAVIRLLGETTPEAGRDSTCIPLPTLPPTEIALPDTLRIQLNQGIFTVFEEKASPYLTAGSPV